MNAEKSKSKVDKGGKIGKLKIFLVVIIAILGVVEVYIVAVQEDENNTTYSLEKNIGDFRLVSDSVLLENGKIVVLFVGAEACPYCAAESWGLVNALQQYGSLTGLAEIYSNSSESFSNIPGYGFANASLQSTKVAFWEVETTTSSWNQKLQSLNSTENSLFQKFDSGGSIPFVLIGGVYLHIGSSYSPAILANLNWTEVLKQASSSSEIGIDVSNEASNITTVIKYVDDHMESFEVVNNVVMTGQNQELPMQMPEQIERI